MFAKFETYIRNAVAISDDDLELMRSMALERKLHKKDVLLQAGEICRYKIFVCSGLLRTYRTTEDGAEHVIWFSPENWWTTDPENRDYKTPSRYFIDAVEDSEIVMWSKRDFDYLFKQIPTIRAFTENLITKNLDMSRQRLFTALSSTVEERYDEFMQTYPGLIGRLSLQHIASYLGVSRKTLSRIRFAQLKS